MRLLRKVLGFPGRWLHRTLQSIVFNSPHSKFAPPGHFYSPLPDLADVLGRSESLYREPASLHASIDINASGQAELVNAISPFYKDFDWPQDRAENRRYYLNNEMFSGADATQLYALMRHYRPRRVLEIGSGFSSALMLDTDERFLGKSTSFTFVEPYPDRLELTLTAEDWGRCTLLQTFAQQVTLAEFANLSPNDILFIDSSHVSKAGSDVNYLLFEVLPTLQPGVIVHFHDIAWPFEYPLKWLREGRAWNEAYLVRAFLQYNAAFQILLFNQWASMHLPAWKAHETEAMKATLGGSLWLRKCK